MSRDALVVGINTYQFERLPDLKTPSENAEAVAQRLTDYGDFNVRRLPAVKNKQNNTTRVGRKTVVTLTQLEDAIVQLFNPEGKHIPETALLYFSGHGLRKNQGVLKGSFLAMSDVNPDQHNWGLSLKALRGLLQNSPVRQQIIWLDCCYSGELLNLTEVDPGETDKGRSLCFIAASREFEVAYEEVSGNYGVLTGALLQGLEPKQYSQRRVTNYTLIDFLNQQLATATQRPIFTNVGEPINLICRQEASVDRSTVAALRYQDWGDAPDVSVFFGRTEELTTLKQWLVKDRCRLVALLGMGGIGKTSLAVKLGQQMQEEFEYVVWRSLRDAPPLDNTLTSLIQFLSNQPETESDLPEPQSVRVTQLLEHLKQHRCLLFFDNAESLFQPGLTGYYRNGYEGYGELLKRIGEVSHQSCLVLTSREKPKELVPLEGKELPVRLWQMSGLKQVDGQKILKAKGLSLSDSEDQVMALINLYHGNPLALKLVASLIQHLFYSKVADFLKSNNAMFNGIKNLLDEHFNRLSKFEKQVIYWLAINRETVAIQDLIKDIEPKASIDRVLDAISSLIDRSLVERNSLGFSLQNVVVDYVTNRLITEVCEEIETGEIALFNTHTLSKALTKDYVRDTQYRLIITPILEHLITTLGSQTSLGERLTQILSTLREQSPRQPGYAAGNILNILCQLETDLNSYDFSYVTVWQAYLKGVNLPYVNFAHSDLARSVFTQTFGSIFSVAFSPDGQLLATGDAVGEIRLWQVANSKQLLICKGHTNLVGAVTFSPNSQTLASASSDHKIKLWNVHTGQCLKTLEGHTGQVRSVTFSPDGHTLASSSQDCTIKLWDTDTGQCRNTLQGHAARVWSVIFSPDGQTLASGSQDCTVKLWDSTTGQCLNTLQGHTARVRFVTFSPDGQTLASASVDCTVKLWNINTGECLRTLQGHTNWVQSVAFSPNGQILASGSADYTIRLWDTNTGQCLRTLQGHTNWVQSVAFSPDSQILASGAEDRAVKLWDANTGQCLNTLQGYANWVQSVAFSPNGQILACNSENTVKLWNVQTGQCIDTLQGHERWVHSVAFSPDGQTLASGSTDYIVKLWNLNTGHCFHTLQGHTYRVRSVVFSPDGQTLASGSEDYTIKLWKVTTGQCLHTLERHSNWVRSVAFSPDGQTLASGSADHTIKLWKVSTGQCLHTLEGHSNWVRSVAFSPDGQTLASGSEDHSIRLWNIHTSQCLNTLEGHSNWVQSVAFSSDGQILASGSADHSIRLWNVHTSQCLNTLQGHTGQVRSVTFSPDGQILASGSEDGTFKLWNINTCECLKTLRNFVPYQGTNITGVTGLTEAEKNSLKALGAVED